MPVTFSLDDRIEQLLQYQTEYGHMFVPLKYKPNNLGSWVNNKKAAKKKNKLDRETVERLEEIGFTWVYPKGPDKDELIEWGKQYCWLVNFHKDRGHCNVPSKIAGKENPVAAWCDEQRRLHVERKLDQGKLDKLTRLGFDFYGSSTDDDNEDGPANKRQRTGGNNEDAKTIKNLQEKVRVQEEEITGLKQKIEMLEKKHAAK